MGEWLFPTQIEILHVFNNSHSYTYAYWPHIDPAQNHCEKMKTLPSQWDYTMIPSLTDDSC